MFFALVLSLIFHSYAQDIAPDSEINTSSLTRAEQLFFTGQKHYEAGEYEQAIVAWRSGYELSKRPAFLQNIALAQEDSGDYGGAAKTLYEYWPLLDQKDQPPVKQWIVDLERKIALQEAAKLDEPITEPSPGPLAEMPRIETVKQASNSWEKPIRWSILALSSTAATVVTVMAHSVRSEITGLCGPLNDELLCYSQARPLISEHNQLRWSAAGLWTIAAAGVTHIMVTRTRNAPDSPASQGLLSGDSSAVYSFRNAWELPPRLGAKHSTNYHPAVVTQ